MCDLNCRSTLHVITFDKAQHKFNLSFVHAMFAADEAFIYFSCPSARQVGENGGNMDNLLNDRLQLASSSAFCIILGGES